MIQNKLMTASYANNNEPDKIISNIIFTWQLLLIRLRRANQC